jgi:dipeptidyl aminopeptidase/acylaminoacyl peptidase
LPKIGWLESVAGIPAKIRSHGRFQRGKGVRVLGETANHDYDYAMKQQIAPYGSWDSPITSDLIVAGSVGLTEIALDGKTIYWREDRPTENGRSVIVRWSPDGRIEDVTPPDFSARSRVHEYGGGSFTVVNGEVYFVNFADQRLYHQKPDDAPQPITPEALLRYGDAVPDGRGHLICVREDHTGAGEPANTLVSLDMSGGEDSQTLAAGGDFYSSPRLDPTGHRLAWLTWNHPNMPWDGTELWVAEVRRDGSLKNVTRVVGGAEESIFQPAWSPDGVLHFVSDRTGWWNLYRWRDGRIESLHEMAAEFGLPQWQLGMSTYGFESADTILCVYQQAGVSHLARLNTTDGRLTPLESDYTTIDSIHVGSDFAVFRGSSATWPTSIVRLDLATHAQIPLRQATEIAIESGYLSLPEAIEFPTSGGLTAHAFYYPPHNQDYAAPAGERPPLLTLSHGGPTSATTTSLNWGIQYWTSRGIGVLDVNYGGSTGYGRAYRQRLAGQWGIVDVHDCVNGARYLVEQGRVDGRRLAIRGGSAGGYTTLCALTFHDLFGAGASYFGVSDVEALAKETHKFESRYLDSLIGTYPAEKARYIERSPIHFVDQINAALILFQGLEDRVVPASQAEKMYKAVRAKGLPVAYLPFPGEYHGFRQAENIKRSLDAELYFYSKVFRFELPTPVEPVSIENLPDGSL